MKGPRLLVTCGHFRAVLQDNAEHPTPDLHPAYPALPFNSGSRHVGYGTVAQLFLVRACPNGMRGGLDLTLLGAARTLELPADSAGDLLWALALASSLRSLDLHLVILLAILQD